MLALRNVSKFYAGIPAVDNAALRAFNRHQATSAAISFEEVPADVITTLTSQATRRILFKLRRAR